MSFYLDVTQVSQQAFLTGIQRIVREFQASTLGTYVLVRFDEEIGAFREVDEIPGFRYRQISSRDKKMRRLLGPLFFFVSPKTNSSSGSTLWIPLWVKEIGRKLYDRYFIDFELIEDPFWRTGPIASLGTKDVLVLMDVPQNLKHLEALRRISSSHREGPKFCVYLHDLIPMNQSQQYDHRPMEIRQGSFPKYLRTLESASIIFCNSKFTAQEYKDYLAEQEIFLDQSVSVLYPPWPTKRALISDNHSEVKQISVLKKSRIRILGVGAIEPRKNFGVLIPAVAKLIQDGHSVEFRLVSGNIKNLDPVFVSELQKLPKEIRSKITILGNLGEENLSRAYEWANVVVVPSLAEGFGLPVIEGISMGKAVVASDATALSELGELFPVHLVDPHDSHDWANKIIKAASQRNINFAKPDIFPEDYEDFSDRMISIISKETLKKNS